MLDFGHRGTNDHSKETVTIVWQAVEIIGYFTRAPGIPVFFSAAVAPMRQNFDLAPGQSLGAATGPAITASTGAGFALKPKSRQNRAHRKSATVSQVGCSL